MDLKESVQELHNNETFKHILATLLAIGNFLNGKKVSSLAVRIMKILLSPRSARPVLAILLCLVIAEVLGISTKPRRQSHSQGLSSPHPKGSEGRKTLVQAGHLSC